MSSADASCGNIGLVCPAIPMSERSEWPTPNVPNGGRSRKTKREGQKVQIDLQEAVRSEWPTPCVRDKETAAKLTRGAQASDGGTPLILAIEQVESMSSLAASPAKTSPTPVSGLVWTGIDPGCGGNSTDVLASFDRESSSWKTSAGSLFGDSMPFSAPWPDEGMTQNGRLFARQMLARHTAALESLSWPTPRAEDSESSGERIGRGIADTLTAATRQWPTPQTTDGTSSARHTTTTGVMHPGTTLTDAVREKTDEWITPQARDAKGITQGVATGDYTDALPDQLAGLHDRANHNTSGNHQEPSSRPVLNPCWVACLMGFPADWLDGVVPVSRRSAMRSSQTSPKSSPGASEPS